MPHGSYDYGGACAASYEGHYVVSLAVYYLVMGVIEVLYVLLLY